MALYGNFQGKDDVRPVQDANGIFQRTNSSLEVSDGQAPAEKWLVDNTLPVSFVYGFAAGVNEMILGKGLVMAVDPLKLQKDFETQKMHSVLTVANGGKNVTKGAAPVGSVGIGVNWVALGGTEETAYNAKDAAGKRADTAVRPANKPIGVLFSNIMKKVDDQFNAMAPTVLTTKYIKLPLFSDAAHALMNPWGSAYGEILPGDSVKSDLNGRFIKWVEGTDKVEQKIGQVLAIRNDLVPEGAAVWATWALSDRENSNYFNPMESVSANNVGYPGYPYDKSYGYNELNKTNPRMPAEFDFKRGIPGLTDGSRVASTPVTGQVIDTIPVGLAAYAQARYCRVLENGTQITNIMLAVKSTFSDGTSATGAAIAITPGAANTLKIQIPSALSTFVATNLGHVDYSDALAGLAVIVIDTPASLASVVYGAVTMTKVEIVASYSKAGLAGVPTMLDWDGVLGEIRILIK